MKAHINIGSNIGDRMANISRAVALIRDLSLVPPRVSKVFESEPWGYDSVNMFYNVGVEIDTDLSPALLLSALKSIEKNIDPSSHRDENGNYKDRTIDIDLIYMGDFVISIDSLQLPHPRMEKRAFVLTPIAELDPTWHHPVTGKTAIQMLSEL